MTRCAARPRWSKAMVVLAALALILLSPAPALAAPTPPARLARPLCQGTLEVRGMDATVALMDTPQNGIVRFTLPVKTTVLGIKAMRVGTTLWCLVALQRGGLQGWLPASQLRPPT